MGRLPFRATLGVYQTIPFPSVCAFSVLLDLFLHVSTLLFEALCRLACLRYLAQSARKQQNALRYPALVLKLPCLASCHASRFSTEHMYRSAMHGAILFVARLKATFVKCVPLC